MKNKKVILSSILSLVLCLSLIAGGTFALFTSESKTNIAVTSGEVKVVSWIDEIQTYSLDVKQADNTKFENGGSVQYNEYTNKFTVNSITPGDRVDFNVNIDNESNVKVKYKVMVSLDGELCNALEAKVTFPKASNSEKLTAIDATTTWNEFDESNKVTLPMSIGLPVGTGNEYQGMSGEIVVTVVAVQANADNLIMLNGKKYDKLDEAVAAVETKGTIELSGNFALPKSMVGKDITFKAINDSFASIDATAIAVNYMQYISGATLTFDGVDVAFSTNNEGYQGLANAKKVVYKNSTITGTQFMYCDAEFINCTFKTGSSYAVYGRGEGTLTFDGCTFKTGGRAIMLYQDQTTNVTVKLNKCEFYDNGAYTSKDKAVVETGDGEYKTSVFNIEFTECVAHGFELNNSTSSLWGNKDSIPADRLKVSIDGKSVNTTAPTVETVSTATELREILNDGTDAGSGDYIVNIVDDIDLTGQAWTPVTVNGYNGAGIIVINGNEHVISGLTDTLLAGGFAGNSGIVINDLTIAYANITSSNDLGCGAFIGRVDSMPRIELNNCHLVDSTITDTLGARVGGLIGWTAGYNNPNDGPVDTYITINDCSVTGCTITAAGSVGAIIGHAGNNPATYHTITNCTVKNNVLTSTDDGDWRVGVVVGTANVGEVTISGTVSEGNTLSQTGKTAPEGQSDLYGRFVPGTTGKLTIDGKSVQ